MFYVYRNCAGRKVLLTITYVSRANRQAYPVLRSPTLYDTSDTSNWRSTIYTRVSRFYLREKRRERETEKEKRKEGERARIN